MAKTTIPLDVGEIDEAHAGEILRVWVGGDAASVAELGVHVRVGPALFPGNPAGWTPGIVDIQNLWLSEGWTMTPADVAELRAALGVVPFLRLIALTADRRADWQRAEVARMRATVAVQRAAACDWQRAARVH